MSVSSRFRIKMIGKGIVGIALTGYLLDSTHSWSISLFAPAIFFYLTGTAVWLAFASSEPQDFGKSERES